MYHQWIKGGVKKTHSMGSIAMEDIGKVKQLPNGLQAILHCLVFFVKRTAVQDITRFTLVIAAVAGCAFIAKMNISKRLRVKMNVQNVMRKLRLPIKTICIPFTYEYYQIVRKYTNVTFIFAIVGGLFTTIILLVFVKDRKTPVVKSPNYPLSLIQIIFHAMQSFQLLISTLKQTQMVCIFNAVTTGSIIKLVILIHLVKKNLHGFSVY